ncbi:mannose-1-phosphate guanylyltransferase [Chitinivibrio alkaliphilus]|uniref:Nucleotidyl transferase n=1 Tax=Chitinivibrio alkaliphilus ACht1 TaxID=1313304 RepID=U7D984_9BACT|nr:sugar phosphate nucleotidyltransferase [Chitinivibrio alkaliphilus]ERP38949.1 Nucleotidyl transferase [Chitinivibrio alkaliphilus ACht1]
MNIVPVILAGGIGERFWPASRSSRPKQLLSLASDAPLIVDTLRRVVPLCEGGVRPVILTSRTLAPLFRTSLLKEYSFDILAEPVGKNTAPAIAAAAFFCRQTYGDAAVMAVVSADHAISPVQGFLDTAKYGAELAHQLKRLVVYGIPPTRPETGYGYLELGELREERGACRSYELRRFVEKPSMATAQQYVSSGEYLWNSGMFLWRTDVIIDQFRRIMPALYSAACALAEAEFSPHAMETFFHEAPSESIDYGILEKTDTICAISGCFSWDDLGSWTALERILPQDAHGNVQDGDTVFMDGCTNTLVSNSSSHPVAVIGMEDVTVVTEGDAVMVIAKKELPRLKEYLRKMKDAGFPREVF